MPKLAQGLNPSIFVKAFMQNKTINLNTIYYEQIRFNRCNGC